MGLSWLLPALIGTWEIGVEWVAMVDSDNAVILLPGAEAKRSRVADGWLELAFIGLQVCDSASLVKAKHVFTDCSCGVAYPDTVYKPSCLEAGLGLAPLTSILSPLRVSNV